MVGGIRQISSASSDSISGRATSAGTVALTVGFNVSVKAANGITKARLNMRFNSVPSWGERRRSLPRNHPGSTGFR
jgi:hypothetical protein